MFCVTDLLVHLANKQMQKKGNEVVEGEDLDILFGNRPLVIEQDEVEGAEKAEAEDAEAEAEKPVYEKLAEKEPVKAFALKLLAEKYGIAEEDFLSAEIEAVPAGRARDLGFDLSLIHICATA